DRSGQRVADRADDVHDRVDHGVDRLLELVDEVADRLHDGRVDLLRPPDRPGRDLAAELGDVEPDLAHGLPVALPVRLDDEVLHQRAPLRRRELADRVDDPALLAGAAVAVDQRPPLVLSAALDVLEELAVVVDAAEARGDGLAHTDGLALRAAVHAAE